MKIKYNELKDTYSIKELTYEHLDLLATLISYVRLGKNQEAFDFAELFDEDLVNGELNLRVARGETGKYVNDPIIEVDYETGD